VGNLIISINVFFERNNVMSEEREYHIQIGKVIYEKGAPKNAPKWIWRCTCDRCIRSDVIHGPFKTKRECEQNIEETLAFAAEMDGVIEESRHASHH
jgi:hypothetical protein